MTPDEILSLYDELGWPSTVKFARALRKRGMKVTDEDVQNKKTHRRPSGRPTASRSLSKVYGEDCSLGLDDKWVADIMTIPLGRRALVVQDVLPGFSGPGRWMANRSWSNQ